MACFASSFGRTRRTADWTSRAESVFLLFVFASFDDSCAILSKLSITNEFMMSIDFLLSPTFGCTCFSTRRMYVLKDAFFFVRGFEVFGAFVLAVIGSVKC